MENVTLVTALNAILESNGYTYILKSKKEKYYVTYDLLIKSDNEDQFRKIASCDCGDKANPYVMILTDLVDFFEFSIVFFHKKSKPKKIG